MVGTTISHYKVLEKIGQGGMGEVYRAEDTNLSREVAIKVLPEQFTKDPQRLARFEREAKLLASLNHPNIAAIHSFEHADDIHFLVLELVPGETLAERVAKGPLPVEEALEVCRQIAEGVEAAHEKGVIHRDLKPANVKVTPEGKVKILDFGLAKAFEAEPPVTDISQSPTLTEEMTRAGVILGTAAYMSPEQAKGEAVDKRADIFAFGCVLYELLTGKRTFGGKTITETLGAIIHKEPAWAALPSTTPWRIQELLRRCLQKAVRDRLDGIANVRIEINMALSEPSTVSPIGVGGTAQPPLWRRAIPWTITTVLTGALILVVLYLRSGTEASQIVHSSVLPPGQAVFDSNAGPMALSPDGRLLAFVARTAEGRSLLWVRPLDTLSAQPLPGTEDAFAPFWSPDSRSLGFFADGKLKKIDASGGTVDTLFSNLGLEKGGTWNQEGIILLNSGRGRGRVIQRIPSSGGAGIPVTALDESLGEFSHQWPFFLPDGNHFLYLARTASSEETDKVYLSSLDGMKPIPLLSTNSNTIYADPGYLLFWREGTLRAQHFDLELLALMGEAFSVAPDVRFDAQSRCGLFSASQNGILTYQAGGQVQLSQLVWFDRTGNQLEPVGEPGNYYAPRLSHNGLRVAVDRSDLQNNGDIWIYELSRSVASRFTFDLGDDSEPVWSPDDGRIVFRSTRGGPGFDLYQKTVGSTANDEVLFANEFTTAPTDWSPDGDFIALRVRPRDQNDIWVFSIHDQKATPFLETPFNELQGQFSPDGKWMVYVSDESGQPEIYIQPFPATGAKWPISTKGGNQPRWGADGRELFYVAPDRKLMRVPITTTPEVEIGVPQPLFVTRIKLNPPPMFQYDVAEGSQRFLINTMVEEQDTTPITLVLNWFEELKRLVPTP